MSPLNKFTLRFLEPHPILSPYPMKHNRYALFAALVLGSFPGSSYGAFYATDFETGFLLGTLDGQNGWNVNATGAEYPAIISSIPSFPATLFGKRAANIGFASEILLDDPFDTDVYASYKYGGTNSTPLLSTVGSPATTFSALFANYDSDSGQGPVGSGVNVRDNFGFRLQNAAGANLFSVILKPTAQVDFPEDSELQNKLYWSTGDGAELLMFGGLATQEGQSYSFGVTFTPSLVIPGGVAFSANISNVNYFTGELGVVPDGDIVEFGAFWQPTSSFEDPGSNYMLFDNVNLIPEPSSALLGLLGASFAFLRRRRN